MINAVRVVKSSKAHGALTEILLHPTVFDDVIIFNSILIFVLISAIVRLDIKIVIGEMYWTINTKPICSVITDKETGKCKYFFVLQAIT